MTYAVDPPLWVIVYYSFVLSGAFISLICVKLFVPEDEE